MTLLKNAAKYLVNELADQAERIKQVDKPVQFSVVPFSATVNVGPENDEASWMDTYGVSPIHHENFDWTTMTGNKRVEKGIDGSYYKKGTGWGTEEDEIVTRERFSSLTYAGPKKLTRLPRRSAIVAFSADEVYAIAELIRRQRGGAAVVMGSLSPRTRNAQVALYQSGEVDFLVATDAIGMGLNLPIRRVLFSTLEKFDGEGDRPLEETEVHQIAGRAGRYGIHEEGFVGVLAEAEPTALDVLKELLPMTPRAPRDFKAPVAPNGWHVDTISSRLGKTALREVLDVFMDQLKLDDAHFAVAELEQMLELAAQLDQAAAALTLKERFIYAQAPVDTRTDTQLQAFLGWTNAHALTGRAGRPWFLDEVDAHSRLDRMEQALRACTLWLWLDLRFPGIYGHVDEVQALRSLLNDGIERQLGGKRPLAQMRRGGRPGGGGGRPRA